ncbi:MAG: hypothetical protein JRN15_12840 [Nitrososphaerota archaeon]|nr:hypothetical protein [Nitrososphaerota archaeon]
MVSKYTSITVGIIVAAVIVSGLLGFYVNTISSGQAPTARVNSPVSLLIVPDYGSAGYDAFVLAGNVNATAPAPATNTTAPGPNNNNITVLANTPVKFTITSIDDAVLENFSGVATNAFAFYNNTDSGQTTVQYSKGQSVVSLPIGHTFTISSLGVNIPIPPTTMVTFSLTFTTPGVYEYMCDTPCGPGMGLAGYMVGFVIVK